MNKKIKLAPSILAADFSVLRDEIESVNTADYLHIDVMDGNFVPNISLGLPVIKSIRPVTNMVFDVHLMIDRPGRYIKNFAEAGADIITLHFEASDNLIDDLSLIKSFGKKSCIAIKPATDVRNVFPYVHMVDMILIMSVEPGFGGQKLISETLDKAKALSNYITENKINIDIEMDGGINLHNIKSVIQSGVNVIVAGSEIFSGNDRKSKLEQLRGLFQH